VNQYKAFKAEQVVLLAQGKAGRDQAQVVERQLRDLIARMKTEAGVGDASEFEQMPEHGDAEEPSATAAEPKLDARTTQKIESLFEQARTDRSKAIELKRQLDHLGVFKQ
jgi:hypothetical protein